MIFKKMNIRLSTKKTVGPDTTLEYLRVILETANMEARLPQNKVVRIIYIFIALVLPTTSMFKY